jgi:hypothetical protein
VSASRVTIPGYSAKQWQWKSRRKEPTVAEDKFKLPGASYDELVKIIAAYAQLNKDASPAEVSNLAGKPPEEVSRNNGFLAAIGIIEGSPRLRHITKDGLQLARAIEHGIEEDIVRLWRSLCDQSDFVQKVLSAVRVRKGMERSALVAHIVYTAGQRRTPQSTAGANCLVEILSMIHLLVEDNGKLNAVRPSDLSKAESNVRTRLSTAGMPATSGEVDEAKTTPAISYTFDPSASLYSSGTSSRTLPFEIRINVAVQCSVDEIPLLAPKIKQLIHDLTTQPADDSSAE